MKMGDKSEAFCRETLMVLAQNTHLLPPSFDLAHLDKIRPRAAHPLAGWVGSGGMSFSAYAFTY